MFDDRRKAMGRDAVVTQSIGWYLGLLQFRVALGLGWENPKIPICLFYQGPHLWCLATRIRVLRAAD